MDSDELLNEFDFDFDPDLSLSPPPPQMKTITNDNPLMGENDTFQAMPDYIEDSFLYPPPPPPKPQLAVLPSIPPPGPMQGFPEMYQNDNNPTFITNSVLPKFNVYDPSNEKNHVLFEEHVLNALVKKHDKLQKAREDLLNFGNIYVSDMFYSIKNVEYFVCHLIQIDGPFESCRIKELIKAFSKIRKIVRFSRIEIGETFEIVDKVTRIGKYTLPNRFVAALETLRDNGVYIHSSGFKKTLHTSSRVLKNGAVKRGLEPAKKEVKKREDKNSDTEEVEDSGTEEVDDSDLEEEEEESNKIRNMFQNLETVEQFNDDDEERQFVSPLMTSGNKNEESLSPDTMNKRKKMKFIS